LAAERLGCKRGPSPGGALQNQKTINKKKNGRLHRNIPERVRTSRKTRRVKKKKY